MEFICKDCRASLSGDGAFAPSPKHFPAVFDHIEVLKNVFCGGCADSSDVRRKEVLPLFDVLALLGQKSKQRERRQAQPSRETLGKITRTNRERESRAFVKRMAAANELAAERAKIGARNQALTASATGKSAR